MDINTITPTFADNIVAVNNLSKGVPKVRNNPIILSCVGETHINHLNHVLNNLRQKYDAAVKPCYDRLEAEIDGPQMEGGPMDLVYAKEVQMWLDAFDFLYTADSKFMHIQMNLQPSRKIKELQYLRIQTAAVIAGAHYDTLLSGVDAIFQIDVPKFYVMVDKIIEEF